MNENVEVNKAIDDLITEIPVAPPVEEPPKVEPPVATPQPVVEPPKEEPPKVEPPPVEPPKVEPPSAEPPKAEPPKAEPPKVEPPRVEPPSVVPPPPADPRDAQIADLLKTVEQLRGMVETVSRQASSKPEEPPKPSEEPPPILKFVEKEEDLDKVLNSVDNFNTFMTQVVTKSNEQILQNIPALVSTMATRIVAQKMAVNEFYSNNRDLIDKKAYVGIVANEIAQAHPEWKIEEVVANLGTEVRKRLALGSGAPPPQAPPQASQVPVESPAFVPGGGSRPSGGPPSISKQERDINDLIAGIE